MADLETARIITKWFTYIFSIPVIIFGVVGAILNILIFTKKKNFWANTSINYLLAGAVLTAIHLSGIYIQSVLVNGFDLGLYTTSDAACSEHNYLMYVTTVSALSFPCWAAFDQYAATSRNANFRNRWSSIRLVRLAIVSTVVFWAVTYVPVIFVCGAVNGQCVLRSGSYTTFVNYVLTPLVFAIIPILVVSIFTMGTVRNLRGATAQGSHEQLSQQVRRMLFPQLIILAISGVPFSFQGIYFDLTSHVQKDTLRLNVEYVAQQVILLLYHSNYLCTFYIYWYMSSEVRKGAKQLCLGVFQRNAVKPFEGTSQKPLQFQTIKTSQQAFEH
jgi:hypothetical protein